MMKIAIKPYGKRKKIGHFSLTLMAQYGKIIKLILNSFIIFALTINCYTKYIIVS